MSTPSNLVTIAFEALAPCVGPERFTLHEGLEDQLAPRFARVLDARGARGELQSLLRLVASLQNDLCSPTAAQRLLIALRMARG